jgi:hypothetical protein
VSAPTTKTIFTMSGRSVGVQLLCPNCEAERPTPKFIALRCELPMDFKRGEVPDLAYRPGPMGFLLRCDRCGFRVEMHGDRLPTAWMLDSEWRTNPDA